MPAKEYLRRAGLLSRCALRELVQLNMHVNIITSLLLFPLQYPRLSLEIYGQGPPLEALHADTQGT